MEYPFKLINGFLSAHIRSMSTESGCHMGLCTWRPMDFPFARKPKSGIKRSMFYLFNIESRKMRKQLLFRFYFLSPSNEKQELSFIFCFSFRNKKNFKQFEYSISTRERDFLLISADWSAAVLQGRSPPLLQVILDVYSNYSSYFSNQISRQMNSSIQSLLLSSVIYILIRIIRALYDGCHHSLPWSPSNFVCLNN